MAGKSDSSETKKGLFGIPYTAHFLCLAVPVVFATTFFNGTRFGYHPTFLSTGYMFFMAESILFSIQAKGKQRDLFLKIHAILQSISTISILVGMWAIYTNKNINGKPHFTTIHAKLGLVSMVMGLFTILGGIPALYGLPKALKKYTARVNKSHKMLGGSSFIGAVVTILLGLQVTNPGHPLHKGIVTYAMGALTLLIAIMVLKNSFLAKQTKGAIGGISPKPHTATPALSKKDE